MCSRRRHVQRARSARCTAGVKKVVAASARRSTALAEALSDARVRITPYSNRTLRRGQAVQRRAAAQLQRDMRAGLRGAALFQRLRPAHGRLRRVHRDVHPLDERDRPNGKAADDLRRRHQTMDFMYVEDVARAAPLGGARRRPATCALNIAPAAPRRRSTELAEQLLAAMDSTR